jgi:hypothetical protein
MAKFLTTIELSYQILQIIKTADREIILVTPYIKLSSNLKEKLAEADLKGKEITLIYGKSGLTKEEKSFLENLNNLSIYFHENLHAKCYFNEFNMLVTSMNLYEFSEKQNREFGIFIEKEIDENGIFEDVVEEVYSIMQNAKLEKKSKSNTFKSFIREKTKEELFCDYLNDHFKEKHFRVEKFDNDFNGREKVLISEDFLTNLDIEIGNCINFIFKLNNNACEKLFSNSKILTNFEIKNEYRIYWNSPFDIIKVYHSVPMKEKWDILDLDTKFKYYKRAIELVTSEIEKEFLKIKQST